MVGDTSRLAEERQLWNLLPQPLCHRGVRLVPQGSTCTKQNTVVLRRKTKLPALSKHSVICGQIYKILKVCFGTV